MSKKISKKKEKKKKDRDVNEWKTNEQSNIQIFLSQIWEPYRDKKFQSFVARYFN